MGDAQMVDSVSGALTDPFDQVLMGVTAENLAERFSISRDDQDAFAVESHRRAAAARADGRLATDIVPVEVPARGGAQTFDADEHIREGVQAADLARLKPVFRARDGTVTAGNASGMNDAGAAVVLMSERRAQELGVEARARVVSYAICGVDPRYMGIGPVPAVRKALDRAGVSLDDIGVTGRRGGLV